MDRTPTLGRINEEMCSMTLLDYLPSLRGAMTPRFDRAVWPATTQYRHGRVMVSGMFLDDIADRYSTPVCVIDETSLRGRCDHTWLGWCSVERLYKPGTVQAPLLAGWIGEQHLTLVVESPTALSAARRCGVDPSRIVVRVQSAHDANELVALRQCERAGRIVLSTGLLAFSGSSDVSGAQQPVLVRTDGNREYVESIIAQIVDCPATAFVGAECTASTLDGVFASMIESIALMAQAYRDHGVLGTELHLRVAFPDGVDSALLSDVLDDAVDEGCIRYRFPRPRLSIDTGESITEASMVTVCRVRSIDHTDPERTVVVIDGVADCAPSGTVSAVIANRHSLVGDTPFVLADGSDPLRRCVIDPAVSLPIDVRAGDVVAIADGPGHCGTVLTLSDGAAHPVDLGNAASKRRLSMRSPLALA